MSETRPFFDALREVGAPDVVRALDALVADGLDRDLNRINPLAFASRRGLDEEEVIATFLHAARLGAFQMSWNVLCPGCGGVLDSSATLKAFGKEQYHCALCAAGYEPTLDEMVEVTFTVSPRLRRIAAHDPEHLPAFDYYRQIFFSSGMDLPDDFEARMASIVLEMVELEPGEKALMSLTLPAGYVIIFDPVTHFTRLLKVEGEPAQERQTMSLLIRAGGQQDDMVACRPGPLRVAIENRTNSRVIPNVCVAGDELHDILRQRRPFLTGKRLLSNQTFRDIFRADTLGVDQRFKITSLTFLFTDLRGSTQLYERVGDLNAFDLVKGHFRVLQDSVASEAGAVVKTIGDAVMATFATPDRAVAAALRMRRRMQELNSERGRDDLLLKIGIHEGPCLAVTLNDRQDYFGQTVNIAARVQDLSDESAILATGRVVEDQATAALLSDQGIDAVQRLAALRGIDRDVPIFALRPRG